MDIRVPQGNDEGAKLFYFAQYLAPLVHWVLGFSALCLLASRFSMSCSLVFFDFLFAF